MASQTSLLRGITNKDVKTVVAKAFDVGWQFHKMTGTTHAQIIWPKTGEVVGFGTTVSDRNYWKSLASQIERICGKTIREKASTGKGSQKNRMENGFSSTKRSPKQDVWDERIAEVREEYLDLALEFRIISMAPSEEKFNTDINRLIKIIRRLAVLEEVLTELHQPIPDAGVNLRLDEQMLVKEK